MHEVLNHRYNYSWCGSVGTYNDGYRLGYIAMLPLLLVDVLILSGVMSTDCDCARYALSLRRLTLYFYWIALHLASRSIQATWIRMHYAHSLLQCVGQDNDDKTWLQWEHRHVRQSVQVRVCKHVRVIFSKEKIRT